MKPTLEQQHIWELVATGKNLLIEALAGTNDIVVVCCYYKRCEGSIASFLFNRSV